MPFPVNWLEELVIEWLDLDGFAISTSIGVPAGPGGKWSPDVVGAKRIDANNRLVICHCEATMWLIQGPDDAKKKFREKFSEKVENAVRQHFIPIFGEQAVQQAEYQKWVITFQASNSVRMALDEEVPGMIRVHIFKDFVFDTVLPTIKKWKPKPTAALPSDKWLLHMIDQFSRDRLLRGVPE